MKYTMILDELYWDEHIWKLFCKYAKKRYKNLIFLAKGTVELCDISDRISEYEANIIVKGILSDFLDDKFPLEQYIPQDSASRMLSIETDVIADTYLFLSLKLAILQADKQCAPVIDQYFLDIKANYNINHWHFYDFEEELMTLLDIKGIAYKDICMNSICDLIKQTINNGTYITVHLDEYYISRKESYETKHLVRENLIYGYNDEERKFYTYGFGKREQTESFCITYDEMIVSFEKGRLFYFSGAGYLRLKDCYPVTLINISCNETFQLTEEFFLSKLKSFFKPMERKISNDNIQIYGSDVYEWILEELEGKTDRETIDYRTFHLLHEHKKNVYRCIQKIGVMREFGEKYIEVVNGFNRLRIMYMKEAGINERIIRTQKLHRIQNSNSKLIVAFKKEIEREVNVWKEVIK